MNRLLSISGVCTGFFGLLLVLVVPAVSAATGAPLGATGETTTSAGDTADFEKTPLDAGVTGDKDVSAGNKTPNENLNDKLSPPYWDIAQVVISLVVVVGFIVAAAWAFKRFSPRTSSMFSNEFVKVLARTYIGPRQAVCLVKLPGKILVVGSSPQALTTLGEISDPAEVERVLGLVEKGSSNSATAAFKNILKAVTGGHNDSHERIGDAAGDQVGLERAVSGISDRISRLSRKLETYERDI